MVAFAIIIVHSVYFLVLVIGRDEAIDHFGFAIGTHEYRGVMSRPVHERHLRQLRVHRSPGLPLQVAYA